MTCVIRPEKVPVPDLLIVDVPPTGFLSHQIEIVVAIVLNANEFKPVYVSAHLPTSASLFCGIRIVTQLPRC